MKKTLTSFAIFALLVLTSAAQASPLPGFGNPNLVSPKLGLYQSSLGFEMTAGGSGWAHVQPPEDNKFIATLYQAKNDASLSVRVDKLQGPNAKTMTLEKYIQRWSKEYPRYGFDLLGSRAFTQNKQKGYFFDLVNRESGKELRQVVFLKDQKAVILTCRDKIATFPESLKGCNQIVRSFTWTE